MILYTALAGGVLALVVSLWRGGLLSGLRRMLQAVWMQSTCTRPSIFVHPERKREVAIRDRDRAGQLCRDVLRKDAVKGGTSR